MRFSRVVNTLHNIAQFSTDIWKGVCVIKWWESLAILMFFLRIVRVPGDDNIIPFLSEFGYTYHEFWYYMTTRLIEFLLLFSLYKRTNYLIFLAAALLSFGKVIDECTPAAFVWMTVENIWIVLVVVYIYNRWKKRPPKTPIVNHESDTR